MLQGIRKNPTVESELGQTAPSARKSKEHLPGKENSSPDIERSETLSSPFLLNPELPPHHVSQPASSSEFSNHHSGGFMPSVHTGKELT